MHIRTRVAAGTLAALAVAGCAAGTAAAQATPQGSLTCEEGCPEITKRVAISGRWNAGVPLTAAPGSVGKPGGVTLVRAARPGWSAGPPAAGTPGSRCSCH